MKNRTRSRFGLAIVLSFLWLPLLCHAEPSPPVPPAPLQVRSIQIKGVKAFPVSELRKILVTRQKRFAWFTEAPFDEKVFQEDLERVEKYYQSQGFFHARVVSHRVVELSGRDVRLEIEVEEGPPMIVTEVKILVDKDSSGPWHQELHGIIGLRAGDRFTTSGYQDIEKALLLYFGNWGYPKARVELGARLDKRVNTATVSADVVRGPICSFGSITIEGNDRVESHVILRELTFRSQERFHAGKIQESQQRLFGLDLFQVVDFTVDNMDGDETVLPVRILLKETKKQTVRVGGGYGTEDQFRGRIQWELRDFLGDGRRLQVNARASSLVQFLETRLLQPYLFDPRSTLTVTGGASHENQESYENQKYYVNSIVNYKWSDRVTLLGGYSLEANRLINVDLTAASLGPADEENQNYYISSLLQGVTVEKVDSPLDPRKGWKLQENMEWATAGLGSAVDFVKLTMEARGYLPLSKYGVLATRFKWGSIQRMENTIEIPIFKRFFVGGGDSVRGYPYQCLGPLDADGNPEGGMSMVEGSVEWRFPVRKPFEGVVFVDYGSVTRESYGPIWDSMRYSAGCGVRYLTLVGPLRLDFGYQLNPPEHEFFNPYQVHFSIGQAF